MFKEDIGAWTPGHIAEMLLDKLDTGKIKRHVYSDGYIEVAPEDVMEEIEITEADRPALEKMGGSIKFEEMAEFLQSKGYDSICYPNQFEGIKGEESWILLSPEQVKSADPVTYDENGNVIPLSQRFNAENPDIRYSLPGKNIETLTETQYNNFGWVRANDVLTAAEYSILISRYADYKHNKDSYPTTKFGEAVIHSSEIPNILMYVKGTIRSPQITKVVRINEVNSNILNTIKEELLRLERAQAILPFSFIRDVYGEGILSVDRLRDNASFQEYKRRRKGNVGAKDDSTNRREQDRRGSAAEDTGNDRINYSLPENPTQLEIADAYKNGEITPEEYIRLVNELTARTTQERGAIDPGEIVEPPNKPVSVPSSVSDDTKVRTYVRTVLESGYATPETEAYLKNLVLSGKLSYTPTSNKKNIKRATDAIERQG